MPPERRTRTTFIIFTHQSSISGFSWHRPNCSYDASCGGEQPAGRRDHRLEPCLRFGHFPPGKSLYAPETLSTIAEVHKAVESQRDIGNVWSLESLRQWLAQEIGTTDVAALRQYVDELPLFLVRRFVNKDENTVIVLDEPSEEMENRARQDLTLVMDKGLSDLLPETRRALF